MRSRAVAAPAIPAPTTMASQIAGCVFILVPTMGDVSPRINAPDGRAIRSDAGPVCCPICYACGGRETRVTPMADGTAGDDGPNTISVATTRSIDLDAPRRGASTTCWARPTCRPTPIGASTPSGRSRTFPITGVPVGHFPEFVRALALVKQAAARANRRLGYPARRTRPRRSTRPAQLIAEEGRFHDQFVVDAVQGGAGTSTNMNANEVIANVALELMGRPQGDYARAASRTTTSTWRSRPTTPIRRRCGSPSSSPPRRWCARSTTSPTRSRPRRWISPTCVKMGRTQLQDAVPMTLGQEFDAFHATIKEDVARLGEVVGPVPRGQPRRDRHRHRHQRRPALRRARRRGTGAAVAASRWCWPRT